MRRRKSVSPLRVGVTLAAGIAIISVQSTPVSGNPTDPVGDRVDEQIERVTERSVENAVERAVERAEALAAERAVKRAEKLAAGKLIDAMALSFAREAAGSGEGGPNRAAAGRTAAQQSFRLTQDENGYEVTQGEGLVMVDRPELARLLREGLRVIEIREMDGLDTILVRFAMPAGKATGNFLSGLPDAGGGLSADYNHVYRPGAAKERPSSRKPQIPSDFYDLQPAGQESGPKVGLIDSVVYEEHEAFRGAKTVSKDFAGYQGERPKAHGTAIASILVGQSPRYRGILPHAELYSASVFFADSSGAEAATTMGIVRALDWLVNGNVGVINLSLTGPPNKILQRAIERASDRGVIIVAAVGNGGPAAPPAFPAAYEQVIAVTAVDNDRSVYRLAARGAHVDFSAPGIGILCASHDGGYVSRSGTSMAAPFAAAILADARARRRANPHTLLQEMRASAKDLGESGFDPVYGHGLIRQFTGA